MPSLRFAADVAQADAAGAAPPLTAFFVDATPRALLREYAEAPYGAGSCTAARALQGMIAGAGSPLGLLALQALAGSDPVAALRAEPSLYGYLLVATTAAFAAFGALLGRREDRLLEAARMLDALAVSDPVTGLKNSRYLRARLDEACADAVERGEPLSLLVIDIDFFKRVNDEHGHPTGDRVLAEVAHAVASVVRGGDTAARMEGTTARMGGEEFAVLLPGAGLVAAIAVGERVLNAIREVAVHTPAATVRVTASTGLASTEEGIASPDELYARADAAMYAAKDAGRDRLAVAGLVPA